MHVAGLRAEDSLEGNGMSYRGHTAQENQDHITTPGEAVTREGSESITRAVQAQDRQPCCSLDCLLG